MLNRLVDAFHSPGRSGMVAVGMVAVGMVAVGSQLQEILSIKSRDHLVVTVVHASSWLSGLANQNEPLLFRYRCCNQQL